ncbi:class I SAM-dependent methyltransferase [Streptomyces sp. 12297]
MSGQLYDGIGEAFEGFKTLPIIRYAEVPGFLALVGDVTGKSVLDIACGTGFYSRELRRRGASRVFGFDISGAMVDAAEAIEQADPLGIAYEVGDTPPCGPSRSPSTSRWPCRRSTTRTTWPRSSR